MPVIIDDSFVRADTAIGSGANSTIGGGNGWIDFVGNLYNIVSNVLSNTRVNSPGTSIPRNCLYRPSSEDVVDGDVAAYGTTGTGNSGCVARFTPGSGGSGYGLMIYNDSELYVYKAVNGVQTPIVNGGVFPSSMPTNYIRRMFVVQLNPTTTQITCKIYAQSAPTVPVWTYSVTDTTPALQNVAGSLGVASYAGAQWTRVITSVASVDLTAGTATITDYGRTKATVAYTAPTGGTAPYSNQLQRAPDVAGSPGAWANIGSPSAAVVFQDNTLTVGTSYWDRIQTTDSAGTPAVVHSDPVALTTRTVADTQITTFGDSIDAYLSGYNSASPPLLTAQFLSKMGALRNVTSFDEAVVGASTANWLPGQPYYVTAMDIADRNDSDVFGIKLGTNDVKVGSQVSANTYKTRLQSIIAGIIGVRPLAKIFLHYSPYVVPGSGGGLWDATSNTLLQAYQVQIDSLVDNVHIFAGDKLAYAYFLAHQGELQVDGIHPNALGVNSLAIMQAWPFYRVLFQTGGGTGSLFNSGGLIR